MNGRIQSYALILLIAFSCLGNSNSVAQAPAPQQTLSGEIDKLLKEAIAKARRKLDAMAKLFTKDELLRALGALSYRKDAQISLRTSEGDGIEFSFGYTSHGNIAEGFAGIVPRLVLKDVPEFLAGPLQAAFSELGFGQLFSVNPAREWALKVALLTKDFSEKKIGPRTFALEFNLLLLRLVSTQEAGKPRYPTFTSVLGDLSPFVRTMLESFTQPLVSEGLLLGGEEAAARQPLIKAVEAYYSTLLRLQTMEFSREVVDGRWRDVAGYTAPTGKLDKRGALERLVGLQLKMYEYFHALNNTYEQTPAGKTAAERKREAIVHAKTLVGVQKIKAKNAAVRAYNEGIPGYGDLKTFLAMELAGIFGRIDSKLRDDLAVLIDPILLNLGLPSTNALLLSIGKGPGEVPPPPRAPAREIELVDEAALEEQLLTAEDIF